MRIFYTLLAIFLIRLVRCGDKGSVRGVHNQQNLSTHTQPSQQGPLKTNGEVPQKGIVQINTEPVTNLQGGVKQTPKPEQSASPSLDKVDSSLFTVLESLEGNVPVLKLKTKEGVTTNKLTFGKETVWEDKKKLCSSALLYMDKGRPTLAVIKTRSSSGTKSTVYKYYDGNKWRDDKEGTHKTRLKKLKEKCRPGETLDISKKENSVGIYYNDIKDKCLHIFDLDSAKVTKVVDGENVIWEATAGTDHNCLYAELVIVGDKLWD
ncbi:signal peptide containing protein [Theileria equi strain WA]|uniref:Signal peptide containing protein n=1 Tax=Theileria equi strain WA TaxID=1537102 RepID=L1LA55_THEEQ|nr:signal peptide containing protein [Theileria equi strain WA]EKX72115.1 signal peptide containing protein [Theileria equi strain WA]|eukprot:XP_004831567.1 signal peptide containing protein [Theileria equi strain WA]